MYSPVALFCQMDAKKTIYRDAVMSLKMIKMPILFVRDFVPGVLLLGLVNLGCGLHASVVQGTCRNSPLGPLSHRVLFFLFLPSLPI